MSLLKGSAGLYREDMMPTLHFVTADNITTTVSIDSGVSLLVAASSSGILGLDGVCGGHMSCATCHCYIAEEFLGLLPPASLEEEEMRANAIDERPNSRLACQVIVADDLDGMVVAIPRAQP